MPTAKANHLVHAARPRSGDRAAEPAATTDAVTTDAAPPLPPDTFEPAVEAASRNFIGEVRSDKQNRALALEAVTNTEEALQYVGQRLLNSFSFLKQAVLANPFILLNTPLVEHLDRHAPRVLPATMRARLMADKDVAAALQKMQDTLAAVPDLEPGMFSGHRAFFRELIANRMTPNDVNDKRPIAVVVYPASDWNGQFAVLQPELALQHRVMFYRVSTEQEAVNAIQQATKLRPADLVVLGGHGAQQLMAFGADDPGRVDAATLNRLTQLQQTPSGQAEWSDALARANEDRYFDLSDAELLKPLGRSFKPGAELVLVACSTGEGGNNAKNLANFLHRLFPHIRIVAPTIPVSNDGFDFAPDGTRQRPVFEALGNGYRIAPGDLKPGQALKLHEVRALRAKPKTAD